jgi:hypothetical protein
LSASADFWTKADARAGVRKKKKAASMSMPAAANVLVFFIASVSRARVRGRREKGGCWVLGAG